MSDKIKKYSDQYWINRFKLIKFIGKIADCKDLEKRLLDDPDNKILQNSLFNLTEFIENNTPDIYTERTFYQVA